MLSGAVNIRRGVYLQVVKKKRLSFLQTVSFIMLNAFIYARVFTLLANLLLRLAALFL